MPPIGSTHRCAGATIRLRVDVDTFDGTARGVPELCRVLADRDIRASMFFSVGPDNMGRHLWRLVRPGFLWKMIRTRAPGLYGWGVVRRGVFGRGPRIGTALEDVIRVARDEGHEIGLHAWDHEAWQRRTDRGGRPYEVEDLQRGFEELTRILKQPPTGAAAPAWKGTAALLEAKEALPLRYGSDCRGSSVFRPVVDGRQLRTVQVPVDLPTYDETIGRHGTSDTNYNERLLGRIAPDQLNVLTIHAEVEGMSRRRQFEDFLDRAIAAGVTFETLGDCAARTTRPVLATLGRGLAPGREGWVATQVPFASRIASAEFAPSDSGTEVEEKEVSP